MGQQQREGRLVGGTNVDAYCVDEMLHVELGCQCRLSNLTASEYRQPVKIPTSGLFVPHSRSKIGIVYLGRHYDSSSGHGALGHQH